MIKVAAVVWRGMIFGIGKNNGRESTANGDNGADPAMQTANPLKSQNFIVLSPSQNVPQYRIECRSM